MTEVEGRSLEPLKALRTGCATARRTGRRTGCATARKTDPPSETRMEPERGVAGRAAGVRVAAEKEAEVWEETRVEC